MALLVRALCSSLPATEGDELPKEFLLFKPGANETSKGTFVFDEAAAASVMATYAREGVELPIDLNHDSLDPEVLAARADASNAMGWFALALKTDGSLWATNVTWTPAGAQRLREKSQRYISPASLFETLSDGSRHIRTVLNAALVARPATYDAPALVAASKASGAELAACYGMLSTLIKLSISKSKKPKAKTKNGSR